MTLWKLIGVVFIISAYLCELNTTFIERWVSILRQRKTAYLVSSCISCYFMSQFLMMIVLEYDIYLTVYTIWIRNSYDFLFKKLAQKMEVIQNLMNNSFQCGEYVFWLYIIQPRLYFSFVYMRTFELHLDGSICNKRYIVKALGKHIILLVFHNTVSRVYASFFRVPSIINHPARSTVSF
jgi:hypothetical protein